MKSNEHIENVELEKCFADFLKMNTEEEFNLGVVPHLPNDADKMDQLNLCQRFFFFFTPF